MISYNRLKINIFLINLGQLVIPGVLYYGYPFIYTTDPIYISNTDVLLDYQWYVIAMLLSWSISSLVSGLIINRYGAFYNVIIGFIITLISLACIFLSQNIYQLFFASLFIGCSLAFLLLDPAIAYFMELDQDRSIFRKRVVVMTWFSGFANTFSYIVIAPSFHYLSWNFSMLCVIAIFVILFIASTKAFYLPDREKKLNKKIQNIEFKICKFGYIPILLLIWGIALGSIQTLIFFELIPIITKMKLHEAFILVSFSLIGVFQVFGRIFIQFQSEMTSRAMILISAILMFLSSVFLMLSMQISFYLLILFSILFGSSFGITTIIKPVIVSEVFDNNFAMYNSIYSFVINISRTIVPIFILVFFKLNFTLLFSLLGLSSFILLLSSFLIFRALKA